MSPVEKTNGARRLRTHAVRGTFRGVKRTRPRDFARGGAGSREIFSRDGVFIRAVDRERLIQRTRRRTRGVRIYTYNERRVSTPTRPADARYAPCIITYINSVAGHRGGRT